MPIPLTETPSRDPIVVPEGTDLVSRAGSAGVVDPALQAVANRLAWLDQITSGRTLIIPSHAFVPQTASGFEIVNGASLTPSINDAVLHLAGTVSNGLYRAGLSFAGYLPRDSQIDSVRVVGHCGTAGEELSIVDHTRSLTTGVTEVAYPGGSAIVLDAGAFDITVTNPPGILAFPSGLTRSLRLVWNATNGSPFNGGAIYAIAVEYSLVDP